MTWITHWRLLDWMLAVLHWREFEGETIRRLEGEGEL